MSVEARAGGRGQPQHPVLSTVTPAQVHARSLKWPRRYASRLFFTDTAVVAAVLFGYGTLPWADLDDTLAWPAGPTVPYWLALIVVGGVWLVTLDAVDTRDRHTVGHGFTEYQRIVRASVVAFGLVLAAAFFFRIDLARSLFLVALPAGVVFLIASRWLWRQWLRRQQRRARYVHRAIVIGERAKIEHVIRMIYTTEGTGIAIVGAVTARGTRSAIGDVPVLGTYDQTEDVVDSVRADTVIAAGADDLDPDTMRRLGWAMAERDVDWVVAPALTDVAGPRIHARPVAGLPLVHVSFPKLDGAKRFLKRAFDIVGSGLLIVAASPLMLVVAIAVKAESRGPLIYRQERIGRLGQPFGMIKFRSMVANADDQLASLLDLQGTTDEPLFKVVNDPRITRVGRFIRKHSIDELPQLFNVFAGDMSLVGPRPQRHAEVALYDEAAHRRLLVKPGMSGLWQVSGRSSLSWEDAIRLDLYYVENWSFTQDVIILFRTVRAVLAPGKTAH